MSDSALSTRSRVLFATLGAAVMAGGAATALVASSESHAGSTYYTAGFGRAGQGLDARSDIKVRGVTVGNVDSVTLRPDGRVNVRLRLDKGVRVPVSAAARIDPVSMFGPKEIELDVGPDGNGPFLPDGGAIAKTTDPSDPSETARPAYELSKALDPQDVVTLVHTFSQGLSGQGPTLRRTLGNSADLVDRTYANRQIVQQMIGDLSGLGDTLGGRGDSIVSASRDAETVAPILSGQPDKVGRLLDEAGRLSTTVGDGLRDHGGNVGGLIDDTGKAAHVTAGQNANVGTLIDSLNTFFGGLGAAMNAPGPNGYHPATLVGRERLDICQIFVDLCPPSADRP